ncbi:hypothetical protein SAMN05216338_1006192 [Bradyrhizobium sp. Rc2d]|nr:hypothetical protein SAMN05216338_1006192 [Bradyrhizobium sp. Rc2d]
MRERQLRLRAKSGPSVGTPVFRLTSVPSSSICSPLTGKPPDSQKKKIEENAKQDLDPHHGVSPRYNTLELEAYEAANRPA